MILRTARWESENGFTARFHPNTPFLLHGITDTLGAEAQIVKAPGQDGATTYAVSLGQPVINLVGSLRASGATFDEKRKHFDRLQDELSRAFLPNRFGLLIDERPGGYRQIRCRPIAKPSFGARIGNMCSVDIEFLADMPHWTTVDETLLTLGMEVGGFRFPLRLPTRMGTYTKTGILKNGTGENIWPVIEIFSASEYVSVKNLTTGKKTEINRPIAAHQKMVIDTYNTRAVVWQMDEQGDWAEVEDVSNWLTLDSEYWPLVPGRNEVQVSNEVMGQDVVTVIRYRTPV
ncbi:phage tail family protein [Oscillospiraceae bacterium OttesenSCG-928-G22]|nr:phage tail family protein [Oscillospiraceae bacterium OttesenSCG-928-G22]